jgi:hypothetical protein
MRVLLVTMMPGVIDDLVLKLAKHLESKGG